MLCRMGCGQKIRFVDKFTIFRHGQHLRCAASYAEDEPITEMAAQPAAVRVLSVE